MSSGYNKCCSARNSKSTQYNDTNSKINTNCSRRADKNRNGNVSSSMILGIAVAIAVVDVVRLTLGKVLIKEVVLAIVVFFIV